MAEEMQSFLSDRRISIAELSKKATDGSSETAAQRNKRLRDLAIKKRVSIPITRRALIANLGILTALNRR